MRAVGTTTSRAAAAVRMRDEGHKSCAPDTSSSLQVSGGAGVRAVATTASRAAIRAKQASSPEAAAEKVPHEAGVKAAGTTSHGDAIRASEQGRRTSGQEAPSGQQQTVPEGASVSAEMKSPSGRRQEPDGASVRAAKTASRPIMERRRAPEGPEGGQVPVQADLGTACLAQQVSAGEAGAVTGIATTPVEVIASATVENGVAAVQQDDVGSVNGGSSSGGGSGGQSDTACGRIKASALVAEEAVAVVEAAATGAEEAAVVVEADAGAVVESSGTAISDIAGVDVAQTMAAEGRGDNAGADALAEAADTVEGASALALRPGRQHGVEEVECAAAAAGPTEAGRPQVGDKEVRAEGEGGENLRLASAEASAPIGTSYEEAGEAADKVVGSGGEQVAGEQVPGEAAAGEQVPGEQVPGEQVAEEEGKQNNEEKIADVGSTAEVGSSRGEEERMLAVEKEMAAKDEGSTEWDVDKIEGEEEEEEDWEAEWAGGLAQLKPASAAASGPSAAGPTSGRPLPSGLVSGSSRAHSLPPAEPSASAGVDDGGPVSGRPSEVQYIPAGDWGEVQRGPHLATTAHGSWSMRGRV